MSDTQTYGRPPVVIKQIDVTCDEFMSWLYCPVGMLTPERDRDVRIPDNLQWARPIVNAAMLAEGILKWQYVYLTAKHGFATPDKRRRPDQGLHAAAVLPLNRPGMHCDGFGTEDINYVWWEGAGSRFLVGTLDEVDTDHVESMRQFDHWAACVLAGSHGRVPADGWGRQVITYPERTLLRLDPFVVHATPELAEGGQMRTFVKVSFSNERYNLLGNAHNHLFDYDWKMWPREVLRNDPAYGETDFYREPAMEANR